MSTAPSFPLRAGSLAYTARGLFVVFFWLMAGEVVLTLMDQIEPRIFPFILRSHGANNRQIAFIVGSIGSSLNFFINPIVSYRSDRKRSRWGRRIPYLLWAAPLAAFFLILLPFAPEIGQHLARIGWAHRLREWVPVNPPVVVLYGVIVVFYQAFHLVVSSIYFYLFRDVVPIHRLGTFLASLRVFGALATFILNYWLLGWSEWHSRVVFVGVGAAYGIGFLLLCLFIREGDYPRIVDTVAAGATPWRRRSWTRGVANFAVESFSAPIYWWTYFSRSMIYAVIPVSAFFLFFPQRELGLGLDAIGKLLSWSALAWLPLAYPIGKLMDRWGPIRTLTLALWIAALSQMLSFFLVSGSRSFFIASLVTSSAYWMVMLSQNLLAQTIFNPTRMGQLSAANSMIKALGIAVVIAPLTGWILDRLQGFRAVLPLPGVGTLTIGPYRFLYLMLAALYFLALAGLGRVHRHWLKLGGPGGYAPPV